LSILTLFSRIFLKNYIVKASIEIKNTEGKAVKLTLATETPNVITATKAGKYTLGGLFAFISKGELTTEELKDNSALAKMTKEEAVKILADMYANGSQYIQEVKGKKEADVVA
jgi:hypothetical protein